jgi:hypothetical protein
MKDNLYATALCPHIQNQNVNKRNNPCLSLEANGITAIIKKLITITSIGSLFIIQRIPLTGHNGIELFV